jgi:hypothetical protein
MEQMTNAQKTLDGKPEEKRPLRGMEWMHLAQDRDQRRGLVNTIMNLRVPQKAGAYFIT